MIISGPPAAGKTTSARPLAREIGYPLLCMDEIKEGLADIIGPAAAEMNEILGEAAVAQIITIAGELLRAGQPVVIEGFFQSDRYSESIDNLAAGANAVLVHIRADDAVLKHRYEHRALQSERHWVHGDRAKLGSLTPELPAYMAEPLHLNVPTLEIDTSHAALDVSALAKRIRDTLRQEELKWPA